MLTLSRAVGIAVLISVVSAWLLTWMMKQDLIPDYLQGVTFLAVALGGMTASNTAMQQLADLLNAPVDRPKVLETTALGAAWLAGSRAGIWPDRDGFAATWARDRRFEPQMDADERARKIAGWDDAVSRTLSER